MKPIDKGQYRAKFNVITIEKEVVKITIGIYKITNNLTKQIYVGQSINIERRFMEHKTPKANKLPIDKDITTYGKENFTFEIIKECEQSKLLEHELNYILELKPFYNGIYKGCKRDSEFSMKVSKATKKWWNELPEETRQKVIKQNLTGKGFVKGHPVGEKSLKALYKTHITNQKPVRIVELDKRFDSVKECEKYLGACDGTISCYFKGKIKSVKGYHIEKV